jgi:hypothetical protein
VVSALVRSRSGSDGIGQGRRHAGHGRPADRQALRRGGGVDVVYHIAAMAATGLGTRSTAPSMRPQ